MINWKVRVRNKTFWITIIPAILLFIQVLLSIFGISVDFTSLEGKLLTLLDVAFMIASALGIVIDHTTAGVGDSVQALSYDHPKEI